MSLIFVIGIFVCNMLIIVFIVLFIVGNDVFVVIICFGILYIFKVNFVKYLSVFFEFMKILFKW